MILSYLAGAALVTIEFDATMREDHQGVTQVSEYHVEKGSNPSDHARPENDRVMFDVMVTNTPSKVVPTNMGNARGRQTLRTLIVASITHVPRILPGVGLAASFLPQGTTTQGVEVLDFDGEFDRVRSVYDMLTRLRETTTLVNLHTTIREYTDMVITNVGAPRGPGDGSSLTFAVTARAIRFVDSEIVAVSATAAKRKESKGAKKAEETPEPLRSKWAGGANKHLGRTTDASFTPLP